MKIKLLSLKLTNFKKIRSMQVRFDDNVTNIFGDNATGKTTLFDAFLWLFFGKDSTDRKDFEIKTLDENNKHYHKLEHEVEASISVDGVIIDLRRSLREKWTKKRGTSVEEFTGHETTYFWNDVPMKQEEYQGKIAALLNENIFKLITNTTYFNSLKWQDRRATLLSIAGTISDADVASGNAAFEELLQTVAGKKSIEEYKKELTVKRKKLRDELDLLPSRIEEARRALPDEVDYESIELQKSEIGQSIATLDDMINSKSAAYQTYESNRTNLMTKRQGLHMQRQQIEFTVQNEVKAGSASRKAEIAEQEGALKVKNAERQTLLNEWQAYNNRKTAIIAEQDKLRNDYALENAKVLVFDDKDFCCPTCKRTYDAGDVDVRKAEMEKNFNQAKSTALNNINTKGSSLGQELKDINVKLENIEAKGTVVKNEMEVLENRIKELKELNERLLQDESGQYEKALAANKEYLSLSAQIEALTAEIDKPYEQEDNTALKLRKQDMSKQLDELKNKLATKGQREKQLERIAELEGQETTMAQELASLEGQEYTIEQFTKAKMDEVEKRVNGRFKIVRFKLFEEQINGALAEACTTLINGVPYADANTASKIQAGLDIINTLTAHYEVQAPVWVDNRESIVTLPETDCQLINLIVSGKDKKLRIEAMQEAAVA